MIWTVSIYIDKAMCPPSYPFQPSDSYLLFVSSEQNQQSVKFLGLKERGVHWNAS